MTYVDTSGFYAYLSRNDEAHEPVAEVLRRLVASRERLLATSYVVAETLGLLQHRAGVRAARRFTDDVLPLVLVRWIGQSEHQAAWGLLTKVNKRSFTIVDASTAALMVADGATQIVALDPEFARLGFELLP